MLACDIIANYPIACPLLALSSENIVTSGFTVTDGIVITVNPNKKVVCESGQTAAASQSVIANITAAAQSTGAAAVQPENAASKLTTSSGAAKTKAQQAAAVIKATDSSVGNQTQTGATLSSAKVTAITHQLNTTTAASLISSKQTDSAIDLLFSRAFASVADHKIAAATVEQITGVAADTRSYKDVVAAFAVSLKPTAQNNTAKTATSSGDNTARFTFTVDNHLVTDTYSNVTATVNLATDAAKLTASSPHLTATVAVNVNAIKDTVSQWSIAIKSQARTSAYILRPGNIVFTVTACNPIACPVLLQRDTRIVSSGFAAVAGSATASVTAGKQTGCQSDAIAAAITSTNADLIAAAQPRASVGVNHSAHTNKQTITAAATTTKSQQATTAIKGTVSASANPSQTAPTLSAAKVTTISHGLNITANASVISSQQTASDSDLLFSTAAASNAANKIAASASKTVASTVSAVRVFKLKSVIALACVSQAPIATTSLATVVRARVVNPVRFVYSTWQTAALTDQTLQSQAHRARYFNAKAQASQTIDPTKITATQSGVSAAIRSQNHANIITNATSSVIALASAITHAFKYTATSSSQTAITVQITQAQRVVPSAWTLTAGAASNAQTGKITASSWQLLTQADATTAASKHTPAGFVATCSVVHQIAVIKHAAGTWDLHTQSDGTIKHILIHRSNSGGTTLPAFASATQGLNLSADTNAVLSAQTGTVSLPQQQLIIESADQPQVTEAGSIKLSKVA